MTQYTFAGTPTSTSRFDPSTQITEVGTRPIGGCSPSPAEVRFKKVLSVFLTDGSAGYGHALRKTEMNFDAFFDRAGAILGIDDDGTALLLDLLDPSSTVPPRSPVHRNPGDQYRQPKPAGPPEEGERLTAAARQRSAPSRYNNLDRPSPTMACRQRGAARCRLTG